MLANGTLFPAIATVLGALIGVFSRSTSAPKLHKRAHRQIDLWEKLPEGDAKDALAELVAETVSHIVNDERSQLRRRLNKSNVAGAIFFFCTGGAICIGLWFWYRAVQNSGWAAVSIVVLAIFAGMTALATAAMLSQMYAPEKTADIAQAH